MIQKSPNIVVVVLVAIILGGLVSIGFTLDVLVQGSESSSSNHDNNDGNHNSN